MEIRSVAIVGAGAVGIYYGCRIAEAGTPVRFLLRSDYEEVRKRGFQVASVAGEIDLPGPEVFRESAEMGPVDLVVLAWKTTANGNAEKVIAPLLHDETRILTLQNGLGNVELLADAFGAQRVLGGLCFVCINRVGAGKIRHTSGGTISLGDFSESGALAEVAAVFGPHVEVKLSENLAAAQWRKLVWNIPFNGLCVAAGGIDTAELLGRNGREQQVRELMHEVRAAAAALGYDIPAHFAENQIQTTRKMGAYKPSSMLDYVNGHPLEVEAIWGEPVRRAEAVGVAVPQMRALYEAIRELDQRQQA